MRTERFSPLCYGAETSSGQRLVFLHRPYSVPPYCDVIVLPYCDVTRLKLWKRRVHRPWDVYFLSACPCAEIRQLQHFSWVGHFLPGVVQPRASWPLSLAPGPPRTDRPCPCPGSSVGSTNHSSDRGMKKAHPPQIVFFLSKMATNQHQLRINLLNTITRKSKLRRALLSRYRATLKK